MENYQTITDSDSNKEDPAKEIDLERWKDYFQNLYNTNETFQNPSMIKEIKRGA